MILPGVHVARAASGLTIERACPCEQEPCGLVSADSADPDCPDHGRNRPERTMRQSHAASDCPGRARVPRIGNSLGGHW